MNEFKRLMQIMEECGCDQVEEPEQEPEHESVTFNKSHTIGNKNVAISASGKNADEINQMLQLAGLEAMMVSSTEETEPEVVFSVSNYDNDQETLKDTIKQKIDSNWKRYNA